MKDEGGRMSQVIFFILPPSAFGSAGVLWGECRNLLYFVIRHFFPDGGMQAPVLMNDSHSGHKTSARAEPQPLPENIGSVQPGGGVCYRIELAWGRWRRWWLTRFWPGYVKKMAALRQGDCGRPHAVLDPRDLKYCRNVCASPGQRPTIHFVGGGRFPWPPGAGPNCSSWADRS